MKIVVIGAMWCSGCLRMKKVWKQLEQAYPELQIQYLDLDMDDTSAYEVGEVLPVLILNGQRRLVGEHTFQEVEEFLFHA